MLVKHHAQGKFYLIACPEGSRIIRRSDRISPGGGFLPDLIVVPFGGKEIPIPADPPALFPLLAEAGRCGLSLVGEPIPDFRLAGVACPCCGEEDVNWLSVEDSSERFHCDFCDVNFEGSDDKGDASSPGPDPRRSANPDGNGRVSGSGIHPEAHHARPRPARNQVRPHRGQAQGLPARRPSPDQPRQ